MDFQCQYSKLSPLQLPTQTPYNSKSHTPTYALLESCIREQLEARGALLCSDCYRPLHKKVCSYFHNELICQSCLKATEANNNPTQLSLLQQETIRIDLGAKIPEADGWTFSDQLQFQIFLKKYVGTSAPVDVLALGDLMTTKKSPKQVLQYIRDAAIKDNLIRELLRNPKVTFSLESHVLCQSEENLVKSFRKHESGVADLLLSTLNSSKDKKAVEELQIMRVEETIQNLIILTEILQSGRQLQKGQKGADERRVSVEISEEASTVLFHQSTKNSESDFDQWRKATILMQEELNREFQELMALAEASKQSLRKEKRIKKREK